MSNIIVKPGTIEELDIIAVLFDQYRQFYEQAPNLEVAREFIKNRIQHQESIILLAYESGDAENSKAVGFCQIYPTFCSVIACPIHILSDLFVLPSGRRSGAGKALLLAAEDKAKECGVARMDLTTARTNIPAQTLYESLGWERDNVFIAYNRIVE